MQHQPRWAQADNTSAALVQRSLQHHDHRDECSSGLALGSTAFASSASLGKANLPRLCRAPNVPGKKLDSLATALCTAGLSNANLAASS